MILIKGGHVIVNDIAGCVLERGDVLIDGDRIADVGVDLPVPPGARMIDAQNRIVMPGLIDAHMHSNEAFEMGRYDNQPLELWLNEVYPLFYLPDLPPRLHYLRAMLVGIVSIRSGVTSLQDDLIDLHFKPTAVDQAAQAYRDLGLRGWITTSMWDEDYVASLPYMDEILPAEVRARIAAQDGTATEAQIELYEELRAMWHGRDGIRIILGPSGPQRCSEKLLRHVAEISERDDTPIHCHVLETRTQAITGQRKYGMTLPSWLRETGCMTHRLTMNHAIWLTDADIAMMGQARCSITHNPLANLKLGSGVSPVRKLLRAGVNVALGCDGVASADTANLLQAFRLASLIHKIGTPDYEQWVSAHEVLHMATHAAARSSLMQDEVASLEVGKSADIILLDRNEWGMIPMHDPIRHLAFSAGEDVVRTSIIRGRVVMEERRLTMIDEDAIRAEIVDMARWYKRVICPELSRHAAVSAPWVKAMYQRAQTDTLDDAFDVRRTAPLA